MHTPASLTSIAFIGNYAPRRCGIATFTHDLHDAVALANPGSETCVVAMTDEGREYDYPEIVKVEIHDDAVDEYIRAAAFLNDRNYDVVSLQHEFGIFGGDAGCHIMALLSRLSMPIVTTLHTILPNPTPIQNDVIRQIIGVSAKLVVMAEKGRELLMSVYGVPAEKIEIIAHGIPDVAFLDTHHAKAKLGFAGRPVILTFGLLSPDKGIETMIDAMPSILEASPDAIYVVLGASHPTLVRRHGEAYREGLVARVKELGIEDHVVFFDQFVDLATLLEFISMSDVYVTPYLNESQMTSGTLAYSFGLGKAVVSTPYWHAKELLADGRGVLVPFGNAAIMGSEIAGLLSNDVRRHAMRKRAYAASRSMTWPQTAKRYLTLLGNVKDASSGGRSGRAEPDRVLLRRYSTPDTSVSHFLSMCDSTGLLQHAVHSVPDRSHGYCVDDNARALIFACAPGSLPQTRLPDSLTSRFAAFIQHAWNPDKGRFRNFMSYDRRWLEEIGSEDSHGRTLWALGECAQNDTSASRRRWAGVLFETALPTVADFQSPRAWAFTLLGLNAYCAKRERSAEVRQFRAILANKLMALLALVETPDWAWFETGLAYDNARLSQALIVTGMATGTTAYRDAGLRSLRWLMNIQTAPKGCFRPVGTESFGLAGIPASHFDQQPVDAAATISACIAAWRANKSDEWSSGAMRAFRWFIGDNDLGIPLIDQATGACADGLHPDRPSENKGAESVLSYLLGLSEIRGLFLEDSGLSRITPPSGLALSA